MHDSSVDPGRQRRLGGAARNPMASVRFRLTLSVTLVVTFALAGGGVLLANSVQATLINDLRQRNTRMLDSIAPVLEENWYRLERVIGTEAMRDELTELGAGLGADDLAAALGRSYFVLEGSRLDQVAPSSAVYTNDGRMMLFGRPPPGSLRNTVTQRRSVDLGGSTTGTLYAISPLSEVDRTTRALTLTLWMTLPILVLATAAMAWLLTGSALRPVGAITRRVGDISGSSLSDRVPVPDTDDEIHHLAITMNAMLDRIERSAELQRQFVSDASHELRSPVATIRVQLETALLHPERTDWAQVARTVLAEDERLDHLIANLLAMARLDEGRWGPRAELDLEEVVLAQTRRLRVPGAAVRVDASGVLAGRVVGNEGELTSVVRNLVDNAIRHARAEVRVSLDDRDGTVTFAVSDDGPGVPPEARTRIFERFTRLEEGRSRDAGGSGLGLALCHRIVAAHGGRIGVTDGPSGAGAAFIVELPAAP